MNLILLEPHEVDSSGAARLTDRRAGHVLTVLRSIPGDQVRVGLVNGPLGIGIVTSIDHDSVGLNCRFGPTKPPRPPVDLLLALPRPKVMRRLWAQLAALGVDRIILTNAARVERHYFDTHLLAPASYMPLLLEGLQQAKDTCVPRVSIHRRFRVLIEDELDGISPTAVRLLGEPAASGAIEASVRPGASGQVLVAVGPEGGWNDFERGLLSAHGFQAIGLGSRTLRTDTACVALLATVHRALAPRA